MSAAGDLLRALSETMARQRSSYHLTLGQLHTILSSKPDETPVVFDIGLAPGLPHSYRGYYEDLAFAPVDAITAKDLNALCDMCLGGKFEGYKGGIFIMNFSTPLWHATYGNCGRAIIGTFMNKAEGKLVLMTRDVDL